MKAAGQAGLPIQLIASLREEVAMLKTGAGARKARGEAARCSERCPSSGTERGICRGDEAEARDTFKSAVEEYQRCSTLDQAEHGKPSAPHSGNPLVRKDTEISRDAAKAIDEILTLIAKAE